MNDPRQYRVEIYGWGKRSSYVVTARSRSAAKYDVWLELSDVIDVPFGIFVKEWVQTVTLTARRTRYDYVRESYGVDLAAGDRVRCGQSSGVVAEPPGSNPRTNYVYVMTGNGPARPWHGSDVRPA